MMVNFQEVDDLHAFLGGLRNRRSRSFSTSSCFPIYNFNIICLYII